MEVLVLSQSEVRRLLPMADCIDLMEDTLAALARGHGMQPLRSVMWLPEKVGALGLMPGYLPQMEVVGAKVVTVFPGNHATALDAHQGAVVLFEARCGRPLAFVDASEITAIRTAAVSGAVTRALAREHATELAILGTGTQAKNHLQAMARVRPIRRARIWGRTEAHVTRFVQQARQESSIVIEPARTVAEAVEGVDIVCTTTSASEPILPGDCLAEGMHINAVGSSVPFAREVDGAAVARSRVFVDRKESTLTESGDFLLAKQEGAVNEQHIVDEVGKVFAGDSSGRRTPQEITMFISLGLALEDVAAARYAHDRAREQGHGQTATLGEFDEAD